jgi:hypothetical protein
LSDQGKAITLLPDSPSDDLTTEIGVLSGGLPVEEITTTQGTEVDYDILIQGSDRKYPAIVIRRKYRGKGATIKTISKFGQHANLYADYEAVIEAYKARRENRRQGARTRRDRQNSTPTARGEWLDKTIQSVVRGSDNSEKSDPGI